MTDKAPEVFETTRLLLRRPLATDAQAVFHSYAGDPRVTRYLSWPTHRTVADTYAFAEWSDDEWERWPAGPYLLFARDSNRKRVLGSTGMAFKDTATADVGYALAHDAWGQGFATEALQAMIEIARIIRIRQLEAHCHVNHVVSAHVLEKCGFQPEGPGAQLTLFPNLGGGIRAEVLKYTVCFDDGQ